MSEEPVEQINAVTLHTAAMSRSVAFYEALGFRLVAGGRDAPFTTFQAGAGFLNVQATDDPSPWTVWGRVIFWVRDVDAMHRRVLDAGIHPEFDPSDAPWGERYFHVRDPDGHELSFARPLGA